MKKCILLLLTFLLLGAPALSETFRFNAGQEHLILSTLNRLESGDTVVFERGNYEFQQALKIEGLKNITLKGEGRVTLETSDLDAPVIEVHNCENVRIKGVRAKHIQPSKQYICEGAVIELKDCNQVLISHNSLNGCGAAGVYAVNSKGVVVFDNHIFNNTYAAIWVTDSQVTVHKNKIYDNAATLSTYGECDLLFTDNEIENNDDGSHHYRSDAFHNELK